MRIPAYTQWIYATLCDIKSTMRKHDELNGRIYMAFLAVHARPDTIHADFCLYNRFMA